MSWHPAVKDEKIEVYVLTYKGASWFLRYGENLPEYIPPDTHIATATLTESEFYSMDESMQAHPKTIMREPEQRKVNRKKGH